jgi:hypothetical protein
MARNPISTRLEGFEQTSRALKQFGGDASAGLQDLIQRTAVRVQATAVRSIQRGPKSGRRYRRGSKWHQASAPGQAPATDTGALASSVARVDGTMESAVGTGLNYGRDLEFGTSKMAARPWLLPALESQRQYFAAGINKLLEKAAKGAGKSAANLIRRLAGRIK